LFRQREPKVAATLYIKQWNRLILSINVTRATFLDCGLCNLCHVWWPTFIPQAM
jgi:hypothetical protein